MTKRIGLFDLHNIDTQITMSPTVKDKEMIFEDLVTSAKQTTITKITQKIPIEKALVVVNRQLEMSGLRLRVIKEYNYTFNRLVTYYNLTYLEGRKGK